MTTKILKLNAASRENVREPKNFSIWIRNGVSELFGTLMLALLLAGATMVVYKANVDGKDVWKTLGDYLINPAIDGVYAGFIAVGLVVIIFDRWSCDLNPAVSVYRMITGRETYRYGVYKIVIQMVAGFVAGLMIYAAGSAQNNGQIANRAINTLSAIKRMYPENVSADAGGVWIFFLEMITTSLLLFSIFSPTIKDKYRFITLFLIISLAVWGALHGGSSALNPARGLAQQVPGLIWGAPMGGASEAGGFGHIVGATFAMIAGGLVAPWFYIAVQEVNEKYLTPWVTKLIRFKDTAETSYTWPRKTKVGPEKDLMPKRKK